MKAKLFVFACIASALASPVSAAETRNSRASVDYTVQNNCDLKGAGYSYRENRTLDRMTGLYYLNELGTYNVSSYRVVGDFVWVAAIVKPDNSSKLDAMLTKAYEENRAVNLCFNSTNGHVVGVEFAQSPAPVP
ncbi:MAG TPA: hypothetical protein VIM98_15410 [Dyella sp.]